MIESRYGSENIETLNTLIVL